MKKKIIWTFNMVEIVLAMGVVAIGMTAVMALLPVSMNASRDSVGDSVAVEAVNWFTGRIDLALLKATDDASWLTAINKFGDNSSFTTDPKPEKITNWQTISTSGDDESFVANLLRGTDSDSRTWLAYKDSSGSQLAQIRFCISNFDDLNYQDSHTVTSAFAASAGKRVQVEVSWPTNAAYANRQKRTFVYDYFKPSF